jgi:tRNA pseudouridine38-40 synthase
MQLVLKFGYNGRAFEAYAHQNIEDPPRTVERSILEALKKIYNREEDISLVDLQREITFRSASRTDKSVSAIGNVLSLDPGDREPVGMIRPLNQLVPDCFFWGYYKADEDFKPRQARTRWYRYHFPGDFDDSALRRMENAAIAFFGKHDFKHLCKYDHTDPDKSTVKDVEYIEIERLPDGNVVLDVKARSFLWHMVRKIVWCIQQVLKDNLSLAHIDDIFEGRATPQKEFRVAPAEHLVLMDVSYEGVEFTRVENLNNHEMLKKASNLKDEVRFLDMAMDTMLEK